MNTAQAYALLRSNPTLMAAYQEALRTDPNLNAPGVVADWVAQNAGAYVGQKGPDTGFRTGYDANGMFKQTPEIAARPAADTSWRQGYDNIPQDAFAGGRTPLGSFRGVYNQLEKAYQSKAQELLGEDWELFANPNKPITANDLWKMGPEWYAKRGEYNMAYDILRQKYGTTDPYAAVQSKFGLEMPNSKLFGKGGLAGMADYKSWDQNRMLGQLNDWYGDMNRLQNWKPSATQPTQPTQPSVPLIQPVQASFPSAGSGSGLLGGSTSSSANQTVAQPQQPTWVRPTGGAGGYATVQDSSAWKARPRMLT